MSASFPFPLSDNRSYAGRGNIRFDHDAVEYPHACYAYQPSTYDAPSSFPAGSSAPPVYQPAPSNLHLVPEPQTSANIAVPNGATHSRGPAISPSSRPVPSLAPVHPDPLPLSGQGPSYEPRSATTPSSASRPLEAPSKGPGERRSIKTRREKPRLQLASDQPLTTQGKPRARVFVACVQCRTRKIRCNGAKPVCYNCDRRAEGNKTCTYDVAPKRRGPDKTPGARQRTMGSSGGEPRRRTRRRNTDVQVNADAEESLTSPASASSHEGFKFRPMTPPMDVRPIAGSSTIRAPSPPLAMAQSQYPPGGRRLHELTPIIVPGPSLSVNSPTHVDQRDSNEMTYFQTPFRHEIDAQQYHHAMSEHSWSAAASSAAGAHSADGQDEHMQAHPALPAEPSSRYTRETWWDTLLNTYSAMQEPLSQSYGPPTPGVREATSQHIHSDLRFLFRATSHWLSFIHIQRLLRRLRDPVARTSLQPSFVLGALAVSTFLQSSESENGAGAPGRERALRLRDEAQSAFDASLSSRWIDSNLVQASWLLVFFEVCAHPLHSTERVRSAMSMLDSLIRCMELTTLDAQDPRVSVFAPRSAAVVTPSVRAARHNPRAFYAAQHALPPRTPPAPAGCWCSPYTLGEVSPEMVELAPAWSHTPAWLSEWTEAEMHREECRRLVWSSVMLVAGYTSYNAAYAFPQLDLYIMEPSNFRLLFLGESLFPSTCEAAKESVWSLYVRSMLLWNSCVRMRSDPTMSNADKSQYAMDTWLEINAIEEAFSRHSCEIERTFLFVSRDYLFISRLWIFCELRRYAPQLEVNVGLVRRKAEEWLTHHDSMAKRAMYGLHNITGQPSCTLSTRPFYLWWFMSQISRMISLWSDDNSLAQALQTCKSLFAPLEYLMILWPCPEGNRRFQELKKRLSTVCHAAGVPPPSQFPFSPRFLDGSI
ncbi:hypothetical protein WOLCODRAFT_98280 [Wolfiporia cocos MD-104 SS10]|uniref:Zn(2)-C6 fungal-type domain-containing protein n=1 Tax=Wolfiporia cocos (strain MD-104) TaxID=742152 RepID=A0A2H3JD29_WOLCO|nr:hypothetical protein WOLCODRAFT_98280 [Wolfiporia cocos MD-104 SS10]